MIGGIAGRDCSDEAVFLAGSSKDHPNGEALEILPKGIEVPLHVPHSFKDHAHAVRNNFRARWWEAVSEGAVCCELVFPSSDQIMDWPLLGNCFSARLSPGAYRAGMEGVQSSVWKGTIGSFSRLKR
jgi:hypothetical protein